MFASPLSSLLFKVLTIAIVAGLCGVGHSFYKAGDPAITQHAIQSQLVQNIDKTRMQGQVSGRKHSVNKKKLDKNNQEIRRLASLMVLLPFIPRHANG
jgi:hypothetical protein